VSVSASELLGKFKDKPGGIASFTEPGCTHWIVTDPWPTHGMYNVYPGEAATGANAIKLIVSYISRTHQPDMYNKAVTKYNSVLNLDPLTNPATFTNTDGDNSTSWSAWRGWIPAQNGMVRGRITEVNNVASGAVAEIQFMLQQAIKFGYLYSDPSSMDETLGSIIQKTYQAGNTNTETPKFLMPPMFTCGQISTWSSEQKKYIFTEAPFNNRDCRVFLTKEDYDAADKSANGPKTAQTNQVFPPGGYDGGVLNRAFVTGSEGNVNFLESIYAPKDGDGKVFIRKKDIAAWNQWINYICQALQQYISDGKYTGGFCGGWLGNSQIVAGVQSRLKLGSMDDATRTLINLGWKTGADSIFGNPLSFLKNSSQMRGAFQEIISIIRNFLNNNKVIIVDDTNYECETCFPPGLQFTTVYSGVQFGTTDLYEYGWYYERCGDGGPVGIDIATITPSNIPTVEATVTQCPNRIVSGITQEGKVSKISYAANYIPRQFKKDVLTTRSKNRGKLSFMDGGPTGQGTDTRGGLSNQISSSQTSNNSTNKYTMSEQIVTPMLAYPSCEDGPYFPNDENPAYVNLMKTIFSPQGDPEVETKSGGTASFNNTFNFNETRNDRGYYGGLWVETSTSQTNTKANASYTDPETTKSKQYFYAFGKLPETNDPADPTPYESTEARSGQSTYTWRGVTTSDSFSWTAVAKGFLDLGMSVISWIFGPEDEEYSCQCTGMKTMVVTTISSKVEKDEDTKGQNEADEDYVWTGEFTGTNYDAHQTYSYTDGGDITGSIDSEYMTIDTRQNEVSPEYYYGCATAYRNQASLEADATAYYYTNLNGEGVISSVKSIVQSQVSSEEKNQQIQQVLQANGLYVSAPSKMYSNIYDWNLGYYSGASKTITFFTLGGNIAIADEDYELKFLVLNYKMYGKPGDTCKGTKLQPPATQYTHAYDSYTTALELKSYNEITATIPKGTCAVPGVFDFSTTNAELKICSLSYDLNSLTDNEKDQLKRGGLEKYLQQPYYFALKKPNTKGQED
jgi:hypothetical protein